MSSDSNNYDHEAEQDQEKTEETIGGEGLTEEDLERIRQWTATPAPHPNHLVPGARDGDDRERAVEDPGPKRAGTVSADQCAEWRQRAGAGADLNTLAKEAEVRRAIVAYHIRGRCSCRNDTHALVYRGGEWIPPQKSPKIVSEDQCIEWRQKVKDEGERPYNLAKGVDLTPETLYHHLHGRCSCDHGTPALVYHNGEWVEKGAAIGEDERVRGGTKTVSVEECAEWRELALDGWDTYDIAAKFDVTASTIGDHLRGDRNHNPVVPVPPLVYDGTRWIIDDRGADPAVDREPQGEESR